MKSPRPFRFPPLSQLVTGSAAHAQVPAAQSAQIQASLADGYQQGMERGYQDGLAAGREAGWQEGRNEGHREGLEAGRQAAMQDVQRRFDSLAAPLDQALAALKALQADYQAAMRKEVVELVDLIAQQVIRCELTLHPVQLLNLVDEALATLPPQRDGVEVYLNADECERIRLLDPARASKWTLIPDPQLAPGECRVKAAGQEIDAGCRQRLQACMAQIKAQIAEPSEADTGVEASAQAPASEPAMEVQP
ncbi:MAG: flagellar assembly protein FliH [Aquabacterium sp.]